MYFYSPQQVLVSDFNGDGRLDYAVYDFYRIYVFFGSVLDSYLDMRSFPTGNDSLPRSIGVGDLNNDNKLDVIVANSGSNTIGVFLGLGFGDFADQITFSTGTGSIPYSIGLGDFNSDNRTDIAVANYGLGNVGIFLGYGNGSFTSQTIYATNPTSDPGSLVLGDVNNDARLDIVVANFYGGYILVMLGVGDGTFTNNTIVYMGYNSLPIFVGLADLNHDAILDIAIVNYGYGNIEVLSKLC